MIKLLAWMAMGAAAVGQSLEHDFTDPPVDSRVSAFWCWLNGYMTKEQITRDLREMKNKGMGGAEIWDVAAIRNPDFVPAGPSFLADESLDLIAHAIREGTKLDLQLGMVASSGWNAGGSWVPPQHAGKGLFWSQQTLRGPATVDIKLSFPECPHAPKGKNGLPLFHKEIAVLVVPADGALKQVDQVIDLTSSMSADGSLHWDAPPGEWAVLRFVCSNHGQQLIVPSPDSGGPMIDFIDPAATEFHIRHIADGILGKLGRKDFRGAAFRYLEFDSMELAEGVLWSDHFAKRFEEMRGYSPVPYLPLFAGWKLAGEDDARFRSDYKLAISDQLIHSHYVTGSKVLAEYGLHLVAEAGGPGPPIWDSCPVDAIKALGAVDVPRGEFWMGNPKHIFLIKEIASASHVYGRPLVDAEAFTTWRRWIDGPVTHKQLADRALCEGLNHFTLHTLASSPPEAGLPGRAYHAGTDINPTSTWWPKVKPFMDYMARCSHMLRQGRFVADVCYFYGAQAPNFYPPHMHVPRKIVPEELGPGYDYDVCDAQALITRMTVRDGRIVLPDGMSYAILAFRKEETMPLAVLRKIHELVNDGATLVGPQPEAMSGLKRSPEEIAEFDRLVAGIWGGKDSTMKRLGKGKVYPATSWRDALLQRGIGPDFQVVEEKERDSYDFIHRRLGDMDIYFVSNRTMESKSLDCVFRVDGTQARIWNPVNGQTSPAFRGETTRGGCKIRVDLPPAGSVFMVFTPASAGFVMSQPAAPRAWLDMPVAGPWTLSFPAGWGVKDEARHIDQLTSWTESNEVAVKYFSGTATYTTTIELPENVVAGGRDLAIDLGDVKEMAEVFLNGKSLGIVWTPPYRVELGDAARPGKNELKVEVTNLWANRLIGDLTHPEHGTFTRTNINHIFKAGDKPTSSGLLGPVRILAD